MLAKTSEPERDRAEAESLSPYDKIRADEKTVSDFITSFTVDKARAFSSPRDVLHQISGLTLMLSKACHDADHLQRNPSIEVDGSNLAGAFPVFMARSFEAIGTLTNLALLLEEVRS